MPHFAILVFFVTFFIIFFYSDASECGAGRSRRYCNTETTRGDGVASHVLVAERCKNQVNTQRGSMILDSGIKLNRTDTTLDLSQKAEKRWGGGPAASPVCARTRADRRRRKIPGRPVFLSIFEGFFASRTASSGRRTTALRWRTRGVAGNVTGGVQERAGSRGARKGAESS